MAHVTQSWEGRLYVVTNHIRQSLDLHEILTTVVDEIRTFLNIDRVKVYRFDTEGNGEVIAESILNERLPSLLGLHFPADDIPLVARQMFIKTRQRIIVDVDTQRKTMQQLDCPNTGINYCTEDICYGSVDPCHVEYLRAMGVTASLVVPILHQGRLWGLLVAHHAKPHRFSEQELQFVQLLMDQVSIAIAQSELLLQVQRQVDYETTVDRIRNLLHCPLNVTESRQLVLEEAIVALEGCGGRLYIAAEGDGSPAQFYTSGEQPTEQFIEEHDLWKQLLVECSELTWTAKQHPEATAHIDEIAPALLSEMERSLLPNQELSSFKWPPLANGIHGLGFLLKDLTAHPTFHSVATWFQGTSVKIILLIPIQYNQQCFGYLSIFRCGYDKEIYWAGRYDPSCRQDRPRQSFEAWLELKRNQIRDWTPDDIKLVQAIGVHLYMSVMQRRVESLLRHQASHDHLTRLPNRLLFEEQLSLAIANLHRGGDMLAVAFLDLDRFKAINETLGHAIGDQLLQEVTARLKRCLRDCDLLARWGGDEFTLLFPHIRCAEDLSQMSQSLLDALSQPFDVDHQELFITASLGIALAPYDGEDAETLLKNADTAMYQAKQLGRNTYQLYFSDMNMEAMARLSLERDLRRALERQEFLLYYQPQVNLKTREIVGMEALIRWQHPTLGLISPHEFIPIAEDTGLICPMGEWVIEAACLQHRAWRKAGLTPVRIAVNVSARQFQQPGLVKKIVQILQRTDMEPHNLEIEITESTAMQDQLLTTTVLHELRLMGIQIAMDDFGTGYSSLSAIKHLPFDTLKIDRSFTRDLMTDVSDAAIAKAIVALGQGLYLYTLAEGVETPEQLNFLKQIGCHRAQGYFFSKPVTADAAGTLLKTWPSKLGACDHHQ